MNNIILAATEAAAAAEEATGTAGFFVKYGSLILILFMVVIFYFFVMRPQKKKDKATANMRNSIEPGDGITTIGGIVGRVLSVKDETLLIETGSNNTKLRIQRWAVQDVEKVDVNA